MLINFYSFIFRSKYMNCESMEQELSSTPLTKAKLRGVIVLTDNRERTTADKTPCVDFRASAYFGTPPSHAETEVDPL